MAQTPHQNAISSGEPWYMALAPCWPAAESQACFFTAKIRCMSLLDKLLTACLALLPGCEIKLEPCTAALQLSWIATTSWQFVFGRCHRVCGQPTEGADHSERSRLWSGRGLAVTHWRDLVRV